MVGHALVLDWQKKLGFRKDPFDTGIPQPVARHIVGMEELQERMNLFLIKDERFGTVRGGKGMGKTMFLRWAEHELAPQKTHLQHYIDASKSDSRESIVSQLLKERLTFIERFRKKPLKASAEEKERTLLERLAHEDRNVLLVDNAGSLGEEELGLIMMIIERTPTHAIFADTRERLAKMKLPQDRLQLELPTYTREQLIEILQRRIESAGGRGTYPFSEQDLASLTKRMPSPADLFVHARERAIELSLKAAPAPKSDSKFLSIKVQRPEPVAEPIADAAALSEVVNAKPEPAPAPKAVEKPVSLEEVTASLKRHPRKKKEAVMQRPKERKKNVRKTKHDKLVERIAKR
jgi:type II secretory pathway predicted ATPase ExeA